MKLFTKILVLALLSGAVCSCNKDNDGNGGVNQPKPVSVQISYSYENTADFFSLIDVDIEYIDANGETQKVTVTDNAWKYEATVAYDKAPLDYACKITARRKDVEPEDRAYSFMGLGSHVLKVVTIKDDNKAYPFGPTVEAIKQTTNMRNLSEYLDNTFGKGDVLVYDYQYSAKK